MRRRAAKSSLFSAVLTALLCVQACAPKRIIEFEKPYPTATPTRDRGMLAYETERPELNIRYRMFFDIRAIHEPGRHGAQWHERQGEPAAVVAPGESLEIVSIIRFKGIKGQWCEFEIEAIGPSGAVRALVYPRYLEFDEDAVGMKRSSIRCPERE